MTSFIPFFSLLGVLLVAIITAGYNIYMNSQNQRLKLYEVVSGKRIEAAAKLMTEAEYLRRGLTEYIQQPDVEKVAFKSRWLGTARELAFVANVTGFTLGDDVRKIALSFEQVCQNNINSNSPASDDTTVKEKYEELQKALSKQTSFSSMDEMLKKDKR